jgi:uncharacterized peroxidase-related enzyme
MGRVPNVFGVMAHSPLALDAYVKLSHVTGQGRLSARQREAIALAVAQHNDCGYCLAAHNAAAKAVGLAESEIYAARLAHGDDPLGAVATLSRRMLETKGAVPEAELDAFKAAGFNDADILEVVSRVALAVFTNFTNRLARTEADFPPAPSLV